MGKRRITVFTGNRAEYGLLNPVVRALSEVKSAEVSLVVSGSHLSEDFGNTVGEIDPSNLVGLRELRLEPGAEDKKTAMLFGMSEVIAKGAVLLKEMAPDIMVLAGDRYETFAMAITAYYLNLPIAHIFGGDLSQGGHLDDSVRHSITKLCNLHFTTNEDSCRRVLGLGEEPWRVFNVGSPVIDNILSAKFAPADEVERELDLDPGRPIILFTQHPVTTEAESAYAQVKESLEALVSLGHQTVITYPCNDAGGEQIIRAIHEYDDVAFFRIKKSLGWRLYLGCLNVAACVAGNSSSGLMETPAFRVPCVNIGSRQLGRLRAENVIDAPYDREAIKTAITKALTDEAFLHTVGNCVNPYGQGGASAKIADIVTSISLDKKLLCKQMTF